MYIVDILGNVWRGTHGALVVVETFGRVVVPRVHGVNVVAVVHIVPGG